MRGYYLWVVFSVSGVQGNGLEVQAALEVDGRDDVSGYLAPSFPKRAVLQVVSRRPLGMLAKAQRGVWITQVTVRRRPHHSLKSRHQTLHGRDLLHPQLNPRALDSRRDIIPVFDITRSGRERGRSRMRLGEGKVRHRSFRPATGSQSLR